MRKARNNQSFWITNITKKSKHLSDIGVVIHPFTSINLLDSKHYSLTKDQCEQSKIAGSLFKYSKSVVIRQVAPIKEDKPFIPFKEDAIYPTKQRSTVEIENIKYEELDVSDDAYAEDNADTAETDHLGKWNRK